MTPFSVSDKLFPALGFGARMSDGSVHHEFALVRSELCVYSKGFSILLSREIDYVAELENEK